jgi:hypothetical protein
MERVMTNRGGRLLDVTRFNERLAKNRHLTAAQAREQANVLERMFPTVKAPETPAPQVSPPVTTPEVAKPTETDKMGEIPSPNDLQTTAEQFVYRPSSERDGKILFMIPARWRDRAQSARLLTARDEQTIEELKPPTYGDDKRVYFRGEKNGKELSGAGILRVTLIDGSPLDFHIDNLSAWQVD